MPLSKRSTGISISLSDEVGNTGKSSGGSTAILYMPVSVVSTRERCSRSASKVTCWFGRALRVSIRILAGMATDPFSLLSTAMRVEILVSRLVAVRVMVPFLISTRKSSVMASTGLVWMAPATILRCFNKSPDETLNSMYLVCFIKCLLSDVDVSPETAKVTGLCRITPKGRASKF